MKRKGNMSIARSAHPAQDQKQPSLESLKQLRIELATIAFEPFAEDRYIDEHLRVYGDLTLPDELRIDPAAVDLLVRQGTKHCRLSLRKVKRNRMIEFGRTYDLAMSGLIEAARPVVEDGELWLRFSTSILQRTKREKRAVRR